MHACKGGGNPGCTGPLPPAARSSPLTRGAGIQGVCLGSGRVGGQLEDAMGWCRKRCTPSSIVTGHTSATQHTKGGYVHLDVRPGGKGSGLTSKELVKFCSPDLQNDQEEPFWPAGEPLQGWSPESPTPSCRADSNRFSSSLSVFPG